jgi:hypothetical protein
LNALLRIAASLVIVAAIVALFCAGYVLDGGQSTQSFAQAYAGAWRAVLSPPGIAIVLLVGWSAYSGAILVRARDNGHGLADVIKALSEAVSACGDGVIDMHQNLIRMSGQQQSTDKLLEDIAENAFESNGQGVNINWEGHYEFLGELRAVADILRIKIQDDIDDTSALREVIDRVSLNLADNLPNHKEAMAAALVYIERLEARVELLREAAAHADYNTDGGTDVKRDLTRALAVGTLPPATSPGVVGEAAG